jgi:hypothetical protein
MKIVFFFLLCCLCNASLQHLRASILEHQENVVAPLKAKALDNQAQNSELLEKGAGPVIDASVISPRLPCCDPFQKPGCTFGVPQCCLNGKWQCPTNIPSEGGVYNNYQCSPTGEATTGPFSSACPVKCCDPAKKPNQVGSSKWCLIGIHCCYTGEWACEDSDGHYDCAGSKECGVTSYECGTSPILIDTGSDAHVDGHVDASEPQASNVAAFNPQPDPPVAPKTSNLQPDFPAEVQKSEPLEKLAAGAVADPVIATDPSTNPVIDIGHLSFPCCDPFQKPGCTFGVPQCCLNGQWQCPTNIPSESGLYNNYQCSPTGEATTGPFSSACSVKCCDPAKKPNQVGSLTWCLVGIRCCYTGEWVCEDSNHYYNCGGSTECGVTSHECGSP